MMPRDEKSGTMSNIKQFFREVPPCLDMTFAPSWILPPR